MRKGAFVPLTLVFMIAIAIGCNTNPPKRVAFESIPELAFIHPGQTPLRDILFQLGAPSQSLTLSQGTIITYRLGADMANVGMEYLGYGEHREPSVDRIWLLATYSLVIRINSENIVETVNLIKVR